MEKIYGGIIMKTTVRGKNGFEPGKAITEYAEKELQKMDKYFKRCDEITANVLCKACDAYKTAEITIPTKNIILRAEVNADTIYDAIDGAVDRIERQMVRHKDKISSTIKRRSGIAGYYLNEIDSKDEKQDLAKLVRAKQIDVDEMDREDALTQMEMLDHKFFLFTDSKTHKPCVVYVRKDGNYGIIETK